MARTEVIGVQRKLESKLSRRENERRKAYKNPKINQIVFSMTVYARQGFPSFKFIGKRKNLYCSLSKSIIINDLSKRDGSRGGSTQNQSHPFIVKLNLVCGAHNFRWPA